MSARLVSNPIGGLRKIRYLNLSVRSAVSLISLLLLFLMLSSCLAITSRQELMEVYPQADLDEQNRFSAPAVCSIWFARPDVNKPLDAHCQHYWSYDTRRPTTIAVIGSYGEYYIGEAPDGQYFFGKKYIVDRWKRIVEVAKPHCPQSVVWAGFERLVSSDSDQFGPACFAPAPTLQFILRESSMDGPSPLALYSIHYAGLNYGLAFVEWPSGYTALSKANEALYLHTGITYYRGNVVQTFKAFPL